MTLRDLKDQPEIWVTGFRILLVNLDQRPLEHRTTRAPAMEDSWEFNGDKACWTQSSMESSLSRPATRIEKRVALRLPEIHPLF